MTAPAPPIDETLWFEAERDTEERFESAATILDRSYREGGSQPPPQAQATQLIERALLENAMTRIAYLRAWTTREVALLHERIVKLERPSKTAKPREGKR